MTQNPPASACQGAELRRRRRSIARLAGSPRVPGLRVGCGRAQGGLARAPTAPPGCGGAPTSRAGFWRGAAHRHSLTLVQAAAGSVGGGGMPLGALRAALPDPARVFKLSPSSLSRSSATMRHFRAVLLQRRGGRHYSTFLINDLYYIYGNATLLINYMLYVI